MAERQREASAVDRLKCVMKAPIILLAINCVCVYEYVKYDDCDDEIC